jgi:hypothetical protein
MVLDKDAKSKLSEDLKVKVVKVLEEKGHRVEIFELGRDDVSPCLGCLLCLTKHPGECVTQDVVNELKKNVKKYDATFYLTPVLFGHFSSTIASVMAKGTGSHNWQVIIGFGEDIDEEEKSTFIDLTAKHRGKADIIHPGMDKRVDVFISRSFEDNTQICEALKRVRE